MPQIDFALILSVLKWFTYGAIAIYLLAAVGLTMLTARLGMRGGWMAWVPILNLFLLCRMARSSAVWILPALTPIVGLAALSYLGVRVARRLGMPGVIGAMFGVPFVGALLPIPMALGSAPLPESAADTAPSRRRLVAGALSLAVVSALIILGATAFWIVGRMTRSEARTAKSVAASLPARTASTLTEFPIDTASTNPAKPTNVITQSFAKPAAGARAMPQEVKVASRQLPPWIPPASLPDAAESLAAADYVTADASTQPVSVVTLTMRDEPGVQQSFLAPPSAAALAQSEPGAHATGIEVKNDAGEAYRGYRVSGGTATHYAVNKTGTNIVIIISASGAAGAATADRLARNLGVGDGLLEDEDYAGAFGELPSPPDGAAWADIQTYTESDIEKMVRMVEQETANLSAEEKSGEMAAFLPLINQARSIAPKRVGFGYREVGGGGYAAGIASYTNSRSAWLAFSVLEMAKKVVPIPADAGIVIRSATIGNASGYFFSASGDLRGYVLRSGNSIVGLVAGKVMDEAALNRWAQAALSR